MKIITLLCLFYTQVLYALTGDGTSFEPSKRLCIALQTGRNQIVEEILESKSFNINYQDKNGLTPLMCLMMSPSDPSVYETTLIKAEGIDLNLKDKYGRTALMIAVLEDRHHTIQSLLDEKKIDVNIQDNWGMTASMIAASSSQISTDTSRFILSFLLEREDIDLSITDQNGKSGFDYIQEMEARHDFALPPRKRKHFGDYSEYESDFLKYLKARHKKQFPNSNP